MPTARIIHNLVTTTNLGIRLFFSIWWSKTIRHSWIYSKVFTSLLIFQNCLTTFHLDIRFGLYIRDPSKAMHHSWTYSNLGTRQQLNRSQYFVTTCHPGMRRGLYNRDPCLRLRNVYVCRMSDNIGCIGKNLPVWASASVEEGSLKHAWDIANLSHS